MDFNSELDIRKQLYQYLTGRSALSDFQSWFVPRSWNILDKSSRSLRKLVSAIELSLAEFSNGDWTERELRDQFAFLLHNYEVDYDPAGLSERATIRTGSNSSLSASTLTLSWLSSDRPVLMESV